MQPIFVTGSHALLGESPVWSAAERRLYWIDITGKQLHRFDPIAQTDTHFPLPTLTGCLVPCRSGRWLLAAQSGIEEAEVTDGGVRLLRTLVHPEAEKPDNRYNDGKCSPEGRFWFGSLNMQHQPHRASLYVLDSAGCRTILTGGTNSNGLGWSPDGSEFYWIDTPTRKVEAFAYDCRTGTLSQRRTAVQFSADSSWGRPDGMTVDAAGDLWIAHWDGGRITRWNPKSGELLQTAAMPVRNVTSLTFGGEGYATLFITAAADTSVAVPGGGVWLCQPDVPGVPAELFADVAICHEDG